MTFQRHTFASATYVAITFFVGCFWRQPLKKYFVIGNILKTSKKDDNFLDLNLVMS